MHGVQRPLSPHLQIYRWGITMWLSSLHRITGLLLSLGAVALGIWLIALASGPASYAEAAAIAGAGWFKVPLVPDSLLSPANGIRHLSGCRRASSVAHPLARVVFANGRVRRSRFYGHNEPLSIVLGLGTAKGAAEHWWFQRLTAVAPIPLALCLHPRRCRTRYDTVIAWIERPVTSILLLLFVIAAGYHCISASRPSRRHAAPVTLMLALAHTAPRSRRCSLF
jgi:succinate dehydrogenase cytochrome b556 subunit